MLYFLCSRVRALFKQCWVLKFAKWKSWKVSVVFLNFLFIDLYWYLLALCLNAQHLHTVSRQLLLHIQRFFFFKETNIKKVRRKDTNNAGKTRPVCIYIYSKKELRIGGWEKIIKGGKYIRCINAYAFYIFANTQALSKLNDKNWFEPACWIS